MISGVVVRMHAIFFPTLCCTPSSPLGAGNQHNLVWSSGCGIMCCNIKCVLVAIRLLRVSAGASFESEGEGSNRQGCAGIASYNLQCGLVAIRLLRVSAGALC